MIGDLSDIPEFSGDLDQLEKDAGALKKAASDIRDTGRDVHNDFQGLTSCYTAPEADQLFHTTLPVRDKADAFADKLETVSGALSAFAKEARPLVQRMDQLRSEAAAFRQSIQGDDDWRKDQKNIDKNAHLVHEIGRVWGEFQELERATATKIDGQVGGTRWIPDDGSHKKGMYGFTADDAAKADDTPWGKVDEREYTGLAAAWHWTKDNVGGALKGFFVDGVWGTIKGLGHMVNVFDWDTFTKTWKGIGDVFGGVSAYIMTPYDWAMDKMFGPADHSDTDRQKKALRDFGKSLIAYDEWGTNPARAGGTVAFNALTLGAGTFLKLGKAGSLGAEAGEAGEAASAAGRAAKVAGAFGKTGRLVDPMTYVAKGAGLAKLKVGDMMAGLKELHSGAADDFLHSADASQTHTPVSVSDKSARFPDGSVLHEDGTMLTPEGKPHQDPIPVESSAADRAARNEFTPPSHLSEPTHTPVHADQRVPAHVGGGVDSAAHTGPGSHAPAAGEARHGQPPSTHPSADGTASHSASDATHGAAGHGGGGSGTGPDVGEGGSGSHVHGGSGGTPPSHSYTPGPGEDVPGLKRHDDDFSSEYNRKGQRKSHIDADGNLVPANPDGKASIVDHIVGRDPTKSDSPYTSLSKDGAEAKDYGGQKILIDLPKLMDDIAKGKVKGVEVYSPKEVEAAIQKSADTIAGRPINIDVPPNTSYQEIEEMAKQFGLGKKKTARIAQRMKDMMHTRRDSEWLIKGIVPREYIKGPF